MDADKVKQISWAAKVLELPSSATLKMIKDNYHKLVKKWHPDRCRGAKSECEKKIKDLNNAYKILMNYIENYRYPLSEEAIKDEESFLLDRFKNDPIWS